MMPDQKSGAARSGLARVAWFAASRPRLVLAIWSVAIVALAIEGAGVTERLSSPPLLVPGSESKALDDLKRADFGDEDVLIVMLRGPERALERQGPRLTERLDAVSRTRVISPWGGGAAAAGLRRSPTVATIVLAVTRAPGDEFPDIVPPIERGVTESVRAPVTADVTGQPQIAISARKAAADASRTAELITVPVLMIVLLLVFGSPIAAAIPGIVGGTTVAAGYGALSLLIGTFTLDSLSTSLVAMMGLALGVDYSLLIVSRFREEVRQGSDPHESAATSVATAGRAVAFAGAALTLAMIVTALLSPGVVLVSAAVAVIVASAFSVVAALVVAPAMLSLVGPHLERWSIYRRRDRGGGMPALAARLLRRPLIVAGLILLLLLAGTAQALEIDTGPPSVGHLPPDSEGRAQYENVQKTLGPGWGAPFEIVMDGGQRPVTEPGRLRALARFQRRLERDRGITTVAGLAAIESGTRPLRQVESGLAAVTKTLQDGRRSLAQLDSGLGQARDGAAQIESGLRSGATGARLLRSGTGQAELGAGLLAGGILAAAEGSRDLAEGMELAREGGRRLAAGSADAHAGALRLTAGIADARREAPALPYGARRLADGLRSGRDALGELREPVGVADEELARAFRGLQDMTVGKADPEYLAVIQAVGKARAAVTGRDPLTGLRVDPRYDGLDAALVDAQRRVGEAARGADRLASGGRELVSGLGRLEAGASDLSAGIGSVADGNRRLAGALGLLATGSGELPTGLDRIARETSRLANGLTELDRGAGRLASGLDGGAAQSGLLTEGVGALQSGVARQRGAAPPAGASSLSQLQRASPHLFDSGYFFLASVDGADRGARSRAGLVVNVDRGGHAARMVVVPTSGPQNPATERTRDRLEGYARDLEDATDSRVVVGGPTAIVTDFNAAMRERLPVITLALAFVTLIVLIPVMRSLILPLVAVVLNVVTVGATFGVLALLFNDSLLGGPGYIDAVGAGSIITVIFGLSIDYEVFVLARMREEYLRTGDPELAISNGLGHTARVVTGAAVIMIAVFLAFAVSSFMSIRNFGVGLAVAVFIDAFIVRLLALPAIMRLLGRWSWWLPSWLDRIIPRMDVELPERQVPAS